MSRTRRRCHVTYPAELVAAAFQPKAGRMHPSRFARTCYPCTRTARDLRKGEDRWIVKARDSRRRHAISLGISAEELAMVYGWDERRMARDSAGRYADGLGLCDECEQPYGQMGHGYADVTLDVCRPEEGPYYGTNTRWICMTDNREKHNMSPERWQLRKRVWRWWKQQRDLPPQDLGLLF